MHCSKRSLSSSDVFRPVARSINTPPGPWGIILWATVATAVSVRGGSCSDRVVLDTNVSPSGVFFLLSRVSVTSARCSVLHLRLPMRTSMKGSPARVQRHAESARSMWANGR